MIEVKPVKTKRELMKFIKLEWKIYKGDKNWVPPLIMDMKSKFNPKKNPLFHHADIQPFIAYRNGEPVGRIVGIIHHIHNEFHKEKTGFFGFFETINDYEVAKELFDTVKEWVKEKGMNTLRGPTSFSSNDMWGLLIDDHKSPPVLMMPYNPVYYKDLIERYGFKKAKDLYAYYLSAQEAEIPPRVERMVKLLEQRGNVKLRNVDLKKNFKKELKILREIYNDAWEYNWGFIPLTEEEFEHIGKDLKQIAMPELIFIAEVNGEPAGWSMTLPDINQALIKINGRLFPFGLFKLLYYAKKINQGRLLTLGVKKKFRKKGIEALFYYYSMKKGKELGWKGAELSWVLEDNELIKHGIELMGGKHYKTYRIYEIPVS